MLAINGKNGDIIWKLKESPISDIPILPLSTPFVDLYTVNGIRDLDEDSIPDVLAARVEEHRLPQRNTIAGHITIISGRNGKVIRTIPTPHKEELYVPLQIYTQIDGTEQILVITGGQSSAGGIYLISLNTIMDHSKEQEFITIFRSETSGFMVPAILVDLNDDGIDDIVVSSFNSTIYAFNGQTYKTLWTYTFSDSESISSIVPGHYNSDNVTDFMVKYNSGPGFPVYYYSQTQILNGKNGSALLDQMINDAGGANSLLGGISISQTFGGDLFLHWQTHCRGKIDVKEPYQFFPDSDILLQSRADTCMLRYNASTVLKLYAITRHIKPPGAIIFSTDDLLLQLNQTELKQLEKQIAVSPLKHPKLLKKLLNINDVSSTAAANQSNSSVVNTTKMNNIEEKRKSSQLLNNNNNQSAFQKIKNRKKLLSNNQKSNIISMQQQQQQQLNTNNFEKPIFNEQPNQMDVQLPIAGDLNEESEMISQRKKQLKNYIINNINRVEGHNQFASPFMQQIQNDQQQQQQPQQIPDVDEYQNYYDDGQKLNYAVNRDIRSDLNAPGKLSSHSNYSMIFSSKNNF